MSYLCKEIHKWIVVSVIIVRIVPTLTRNLFVLCGRQCWTQTRTKTKDPPVKKVQ